MERFQSPAWGGVVRLLVQQPGRSTALLSSRERSGGQLCISLNTTNSMGAGMSIIVTMKKKISNAHSLISMTRRIIATSSMGRWCL
jgi:hypothetical protein